MEPTENIKELFEKDITGEINEKEKEYLLSILNNDSQICEEYELWKKIDSSIRKTNTIELRQKLRNIVTESNHQITSTNLKKNILTRWYSIAAMVLILLSAGYGFYHMVSQKADNTESEIFAMNYEESPYLESSILQTRSDEIQIKSPKHAIDYKKNDNIIFDWNNPVNEIVQLLILNNKEKILVDIEIVSPPYTFKQNLSPGLYYWKLETDNDLLHSDKFYIK